jgi:peptidoglycan/LPS O-acetylase OafA/YrhL
MVPSSPRSESQPFLESEKVSSPPSPTLMAFNLLRQVTNIPTKLLRPSKSYSGSFLLPSFLQPRSKSDARGVSKTAWLDGMRGLAAFFVYIRHFASATHPAIQVGYGTDPANRYLIQLPFLHLIVSGPAMVALFFIISGYALSWGPLRAIHSESSAACLKRLSSATFRRAVRLFLPGVASTFLIMLCISAGLYDKGNASFNPQDMPGFLEPQPPMYRNEPLIVQVRSWFQTTWMWLQIWVPAGHPYDVHLWTLPVEFRCSMILFLALVGFARTTPFVRLGLLIGSTLYCHYTNFWEGWLFFAGSALAQLKILQDEGAEEVVSPLLLAECGGVEESCENGMEPRQISKMDFGRLVLFVAGLYLLSSPDYGFGESLLLILFHPNVLAYNTPNSGQRSRLSLYTQPKSTSLARKLALSSLHRRSPGSLCHLLHLDTQPPLLIR